MEYTIKYNFYDGTSHYNKQRFSLEEATSLARHIASISREMKNIEVVKINYQTIKTIDVPTYNRQSPELE